MTKCYGLSGEKYGSQDYFVTEDAQTLLVINDNNFPYGGGRALASDNTELLKIRLAKRISGFEHHGHSRNEMSGNCNAPKEHHHDH